MPISKLVGVGFLGSLGLTFILIGCVISGTWWTLLLFLLYGLTPVPLLFVRGDGYETLGESTNKSLDIAVFFVAGIILSTFAAPILLSRTPVDGPRIDFTNALLAELGTVLIYITGGLFMIASNEETD